jgi:putative transposase
VQANSRKKITKEQRRTLTAKGELVYTLEARAFARGLLSADDLREFRAFRKRVGRVQSTSEAIELELETDRRLEQLRELLGELSTVPTRESDGWTAAPATVSTTGVVTNERATSIRESIDDAIEREEEKRKIMRVVRSILNGTSARDALNAEGFPSTPARIRWALRQRQHFERHGTIDDLRAVRSGRRPDVMTAPMQTALTVLWHRHRHASASGLLRALRAHISKTEQEIVGGALAHLRHDETLLLEEIQNGNIRIPSIQSVQSFIRGKSKSEKLLRNEGRAEYQRQNRPLGTLTPTRFANELWELDHSRLDIHAKELVDDEWRHCQVWLTVLIDVHSRSIVNAVVSGRTPDSFTTAMLLRGAILPLDGDDTRRPFGIPQLIRTDRGADFMAVQTQAFCRAVGIDLDFCKPRRPDEKPFVERFFGTIQGNLLPLLPGYKHGNDRGDSWTSRRIMNLLTVQQIRAEIDRWIREYNNSSHSELKERPLNRWRESVAHRDLPNREQLNMLLLHRQTRVVRNTVVGLVFASGAHKYWGECLPAMNGQTISLRYNPDDDEVIYAYDERDVQFLGELRRTDLVGMERINAAWQNFKREKFATDEALDARVQEYHTRAQEDDRVRKAELRAKREQAEVERMLRMSDDATPVVPSLEALGVSIRPGKVAESASQAQASSDATSPEQKLEEYLRRLSA